MSPGKTPLSSTPYYDELREAMALAGCPVCRLLDQTANVQIDSVLWEMVNVPAFQEEFQRSRGYCRHHSWMMVRGGAALGISILMQSVFDVLLETLDQYDNDTSGHSFQQLRHALGFSPGGRVERLITHLSPQSECPICLILKPIESGYISTLLSHLVNDDALREIYQQSHGLCLAHLQQGIQSAGSGKSLDALLAAQRHIWQHLKGQLAEFIRKNDYRFSKEPVGIEGDAWQRALEALYGAPPQPPGLGRGLTSDVKC
ncbi:MAG: hypothetical protein KDJ52_22440 [Anaerolineae bacterium]|nr:hypothetical protein [Anaerolineae bacterium]